ncbi:hypothetical protein M758_2G209300 [Ceratodon purpureus]|nr:hypothetical protein M758_2G209300 [Ceratodon purpureus]KAG0627538.1 hypothetical protein M758_2G209300 [Ceratodon purpureus]KAG0627539.1 hypothetical protein M758_2G209300 [Ceratodon purpureus]KAG0627540.1 hypothetical protein M758_2G209300 [Ceratodon purpureus]
MEEAKIPFLGYASEVEEEPESIKEHEALIEEVKLTVPETDDPSIPTLTFRTWTLGIILCAFLSFVNQFFKFRTSPIAISAIAGQMASLYLGRAMAATLPDKTFLGVRINPGPFNIKEHVLITVFAHAGGNIKESTARAIETITLIKLPAFFNRDMPLTAAILFTVSTQILGYGWAGLLRKYLVEPAHMWWPATLVDVSLFRTLHEQEHTKGMSRMQFFVIAAVGSFAWYILPGYLFATITSLSWVCWAWKDSIAAHQIGSGLNGLGFMSISLDWATISAILGSPLSTPWPTILNVFIGFIFAAYVVVPAMYMANTYNTQRYPLISNKLYLPDGRRYKVSEVVAKDGLTLDLEKYNQYGPPHVSAFYAVLHWGLLFASLGATITHVILWHGKFIYQQYRTAPEKSKPSIHTKMMQKYNDIPSWWFWALLVGNTSVGIALVTLWPQIFQLPWWGVIMGCLMSIFFTLPIGVLAATTNRFTGVGPLCDVLMGYMFPGFPIANVCFRMYSAESIAQGLAFLRDFKLGHYMKIPPRAMLAVQVSGAIVGGLVNLGCAYWMFNSIENLCEEAGPWSCPGTTNSFSVVSLWGLIGSSRLIGEMGEYKQLKWLILAGVLAPIPFWIISKSSKSKKIQDYSRQVNMPVLLGAANQWPPAIAVTYSSWFLTGFIFNFCIFKYHQRWWQKYNYILSAALDTGVAFAGPLIFFTLLNFNKTGPKWWGNPSQFIDNCPLAFCPTAKGINITDQYPFCPVH